MRKKLITIVGPTAVGKTGLSIELAKRCSGEVINADSRQVYRYMDIGTAKPSAEERVGVPHHLIDITNPDEPFSLSQYQEMAMAALEDVLLRGKLPFLVGGTGQYVWAVLEGWNVPRVPPDFELRHMLEERALQIGQQALWQELEAVDLEAAKKIHPQNVRRVIRALEVYERLGRPISACQTHTPPDCDVLIVGLTCPREELHRRIDERVEAMIAAGWVEEVRGLLAMGYGPELPALSSVGYREIYQHLAGDITLEQAVERIKVENHRLVRHQHAWFKPGDERIRWIDSVNGALKIATEIVEEFIMSEKPMITRTY
jgi:tRNA dimethylallyltransferase